MGPGSLANDVMTGWFFGGKSVLVESENSYSTLSFYFMLY